LNTNNNHIKHILLIVSISKNKELRVAIRDEIRKQTFDKEKFAP
jgi:hypothetical protein